MQKLKLAYFGSPSFSANLLEKIILDKSLPVEVVLVLTQPDKPVGRKQIITPSPVKIIASKYGIKILQDSSIFSAWRIKGDSTGDKNDTIGRKWDLALVYAFGEILPNGILSLPKYGFWNIHPSLLPFYRGASPIAYPLMLDDKTTGVSLMLMDEEMDHGPLLVQKKMNILPDDTRSDLENKLTSLGFEMFKKQIVKLYSVKNADFLPGHLCTNKRAVPSNSFTLARDKKYAFELIEQNHSSATYTKKSTKSDGFISFTTLKKMLHNEKITINELPHFLQEYKKKYSPSFSLPQTTSILLFNLFRGLSPWPGIWTMIKLKDREARLKITEMKIADNQLIITRVQLEGKKEVDFTTFQKAYSLL